MWNLVNFSNVELWIHFSPDSVQRCWNFAMGSVLARLFRPDPQDVWIKLSKPVLDKYFESVQLSDEKLIHQAALVNFHFEEDPTLPPAAQLDFVEQFKLYLLLSARVQLADIVEKNFALQLILNFVHWGRRTFVPSCFGWLCQESIWGWWQTALCSRPGTLGWSLNRWVLWEIISTFRSPLVPLSYFTLSTSRYHRCRVLSEWRSATLMHLSLLDFDHFGKTGNQMEEHFGTGTTWITLFTSRDLSSWTLGHFQGRCWITLLSAVCIMASTLCILYSTLIVSGVALDFRCWCAFQWPEINEGLSRTGTFQETPRGTLSLRLHVADFETLIFGCCNFELSATCQDLTFVQLTLNSLTCKDCTLDLKHLWL